MKKKNLLIAIGSIVLTIACTFAGIASAKFNLVYIYVSTAGGGCRNLIVTNPSSNTFTVGGIGNQATVANTTGLWATSKLWGSSNCAAGAIPVHFHG